MIRISSRSTASARQPTAPDANLAASGARTCLALRRIDPARNMARFYLLALEPNLFGEVALVRQWGRIGTIGRQRIDLHISLAEASAAFQRLAQTKRQRGYR